MKPISRRALPALLAGLTLTMSTGACSPGEEEEPVPTPEASSISDPRGLAKSGQTSRGSASDIAQQVAERLVVRDGTTVEQMVQNLEEQGLLAEGSSVKVDSATGLDDVVEKTFQHGQTLDLVEPSKVGRYGELPDSSTAVERSVSLSLQGISTESLDNVGRVDYVATAYVVLQNIDDKWVATGFQVLAFSAA